MYKRQLPEYAPEEWLDRAVLWNSVELNEKQKNAQLCRTLKAALPNDWSYELAEETVRDYVQRNLDVYKRQVNYKDIIFDFKRREVVKSNEEKKFTYTEFEILQLLAQNPGRVFSKEQIYDMVWQEPYSGDYNIVMSHISHIREKIEDDPSHPVYIQTVWGVGYKFNEKMCE